MTSGVVKIGSLDHVHLRVPDRDAAVAWYCEHLGFELIEEQRFWAEGIVGGPAQISADGGRTAIALFQGSEHLPAAPLTAGVAFGVDGPTFVEFARALPGPLEIQPGEALRPGHLVDFDLCFAYDFCDPWGTRIEINTYDVEHVRAELLVADGVEPRRYWPAEVHEQWMAGDGANAREAP